jgi:SAM-dependent methyltransferase
MPHTVRGDSLCYTRTKVIPVTKRGNVVQPIGEYYEALAATYDTSRFGNAYGRYVDASERAILRDWLRPFEPEAVVDLGCGTGRLLDFAATGVDGSAAMLEEAARKHPRRQLIHADLASTGLEPRAFDAAICFHVLMHLDEPMIASVLGEAARLVRPAGRFVFDIPSRDRRSLGRRQPSGWHGDTSASLADVARWAGAAWRLARWRGIVLFPIHRVPSALRGPLRPLDAAIGRTPLGRWSSYLVCELERR